MTAGTPAKGEASARIAGSEGLLPAAGDRPALTHPRRTIRA